MVLLSAVLADRPKARQRFPPCTVAYTTQSGLWPCNEALKQCILGAQAKVEARSSCLDSRRPERCCQRMFVLMLANSGHIH